MPKPKSVKTKTGYQHFSVGALIKNKNKFLIINRKMPSPGYAGIAGHIDENEAPLHALEREIKEESGLTLKSHRFLFKKLIIQKEDCLFKEKRHKWYVYECICEGKLEPSKKEVKEIVYTTKKQIKKLLKNKQLEYSWLIILKKLKIV